MHTYTNNLPCVQWLKACDCHVLAESLESKTNHATLGLNICCSTSSRFSAILGYFFGLHYHMSNSECVHSVSNFQLLVGLTMSIPPKITSNKHLMGNMMINRRILELSR